MLEFCSLASGSSGNSYFIQTKKIKILVDAGFSGKQIENKLKEIDINAKDLDYIFVTHEHGDHAKGVGVLSRRYGIPVVANYPTWQGLNGSIGKIRPDLQLVFESGEDFTVDDLDVHPLPLFHDSNEAVGYIFEYKNKKISIVTDTGFVSKEMINKIKDSDLYLIEANHDPDMLRQGPYPLHLQERIRAKTGHISNQDCAETLAKALKAEGEYVILGHISGENNRPLMALNTVTEILEDYGLKINQDIKLKAASRDAVGNKIIL